MEEKEMEEMFCFQCQQTAHNTGCEGHTGVCGKKSDTANLQDELTGELIRLARAVTENERSRSSDELMLKGLFTTITNVNFNSDYHRRCIAGECAGSICLSCMGTGICGCGDYEFLL